MTPRRKVPDEMEKTKWAGADAHRPIFYIKRTSCSQRYKPTFTHDYQQFGSMKAFFKHQFSLLTLKAPDGKMYVSFELW